MIWEGHKAHGFMTECSCTKLYYTVTRVAQIGQIFQKTKPPYGCGCSFPGSNFILILPPIFKFYPNPDLKLLFYPNPETECEFYPNPDQKLFYLSPEIEFYPRIPAKNKFYPFIREERRHQLPAGSHFFKEPTI